MLLAGCGNSKSAESDLEDKLENSKEITGSAEDDDDRDKEKTGKKLDNTDEETEEAEKPRLDLDFAAAFKEGYTTMATTL